MRSPALIHDQRQQVCMRLFVSRNDKTARPGVDWPPVDSGHHTAGRLAQGEASRKVNVVVQVAIGEVCGAAAGSHPSHSQGGGHHARAEVLVEPLVTEHPGRQERLLVGEWWVKIDID